MSRIGRRPLRGSVTQNTEGTTIRLRDDAMTSRGFLLRLGILVGGVLAFIIFIAWSWQNGWPRRAINATTTASLELTRRMNFAVRDIIVMNRQHTSKDAISAALGIKLGGAIFGFDPAAAQARIVTLPWVADAIVERHFPDTIIVHLTERVPLARWQKNNQIVVIDSKGDILTDISPQQFTTLPLVVGVDADKNAHDLITLLQNYPTVRKHVTAATRVGERRWDLYLQTKIIAKLPENDVADALKRLSELITEKNILERSIVSIDLRLPDRIILEPATTASPASIPAEKPRQ